MQDNFTGFAAQSERPATFQAYPTVPDGQRLPDKRSLPLEPLVAMLLPRRPAPTSAASARASMPPCRNPGREPGP